MSEVPMLALEELMAKRCGSVDPSKFPGEQFDLYSIPAFDKGCHEVVVGSSIGSAKQIVQPNDVLLSKIVPHIRRSWVVGRDDGRRLIASGEWIVFRSERADPAYLRHVLVSDPFHSQFMQTVSGVGGSLLRARPAQVSKIKIPLPTLPEQRRIAAILDQADVLRAKRREALALLDELQRGIFVRMFGEPVSNPKSWPTKTLKELGRVRTGGTPPSSKQGMFNGNVPFVTPGDLGSNLPTKRTVTEQGAAEVVTVRAGAALVCCIGATIGKMDKAKSPCAFNQQINAVEWYDEIDDDFGFHAMCFYRGLIAALGASTTLPILKKSSFEKIELPVPPMPLQQEFAKRVNAMSVVREKSDHSRTELGALFASLQHRAFRGEL